jgi:ABC-type branched-subunit amino acid transport system substrate-binding protein
MHTELTRKVQMISRDNIHQFVGCIVSCLLLFSGQVTAETFDLGGMYTYHYRDGRYADWGDYALHGAHIAIEEANGSGMLGDDDIRLARENTIDYHCWPENAARMAETLMQKDILVLTGADCSGPAVEIARVAAQYKVPVISNGANASALSSAEDYPWFVRVVTPSEAYEGYLIDVAAHFGVDEIAYFYTTDAWGLGARKVIHDYASRRDIRIEKEYAFARDTDQETITGYLSEAKDAGIRHIVMTGPTPDTVTVFQGLNALDMNKPGYSIYASEMISSDEGSAAVEGSLGYFAPMTMIVDSEIMRRFRSSLEARLGHEVDINSKAFFYGALSYDHVLAVAHAIKAAKDDGEVVSRESMMTYLRQMDFDGATGHISLVPGTNDRANMPVQIFNSHGYKEDRKTVKFVPVGSVNPSNGQLFIEEDLIVWPGGSSELANE